MCHYLEVFIICAHFLGFPFQGNGAVVETNIFPTTCKYSVQGMEYKGTVAVTNTGKTCIDWETAANVQPDQGFPEASRAAASNYCRNPDAEVDVWCYHSSPPATDWEVCDIPYCDECSAVCIGSSCYLIFTTQVDLTWADAADHCDEYGASLAGMETEAEHGALMPLLSQHREGIKTKTVWTSLNQKLSGGPWYWGDVVATYMPRELQAGPEPDGIGAGDGYGYLSPQDFLLADAPASTTLGVMCQGPYGPAVWYQKPFTSSANIALNKLLDCDTTSCVPLDTMDTYPYSPQFSLDLQFLGKLSSTFTIDATFSGVLTAEQQAGVMFMTNLSVMKVPPETNLGSFKMCNITSEAHVTNSHYKMECDCDGATCSHFVVRIVKPKASNIQLDLCELTYSV